MRRSDPELVMALPLGERHRVRQLHRPGLGHECRLDHQGAVDVAAFAAVLALYLLGRYLVIRSKSQSSLWLILAALGPLGFAILSVLNDRQPSQTDRYARFLRSMHWLLRAAYETACFFLICELSWNLMLLKRYAMIKYQAITTGQSTAQIIAIQDASSGMWAFAEGLEIMFFVIVLYVLRPILFNLAACVITPKPTIETS